MVHSKIRHLKCDETKPECQRCLKDMQRCDGYQQAQAQAPRPNAGTKLRMERSSRRFQYQSKPTNAICKAPGVLRPALSIVHHASPADAVLFHHAREYTIKDFGVDSCLSFWNGFVLPLAQTAEPVRYALCALGGAHRRFITEYPGDATYISTAAAYELVSIQKYNQAIMHIKPLMTEKTEASLQTILICCVIFICIENLNGRYTDSMRHLLAGCQLLNSLRGKFKLERSNLAQMHFKEAPNITYSLFGMVTEMLHRLGQNIAIYKGSYIFTDLELPPRMTDMGDSRLPFADLVEAGTLLDQVDDSYDSFFRGHQLTSLPTHASSDNDSFSRPDLATGQLALAAVRSTFAIWNSRYELTRKVKRHGSPCLTEQHGLFLDMQQAMWLAILKLDSIDGEFNREDSELILQRASNLIKMVASKRAPVFAFNGYITPTLSIVCSSCKDLNVQRKSIALLRTLRRREGIWDSREVADIYETMVTAGAQNMVDQTNMPWGIPQLVAELSPLSLPRSNDRTPQSP
ncbi:hypothetical protein FSARC_13795 [Fusarium sarcochroum]|uniref:Zn(2)-C6 fungal-type domain-containing protein n=1 Tax=Fusarium sarcochroum TaxID=1208366 RepID=A0A8H4SYZ1_9HYPO|nr:hypothetical protein FSARC_13795 [Fusarium sarcochroum]